MSKHSVMYLSIAIVCFSFLVCTRPAHASWVIDLSGTLIQREGNVLGDDIDRSPLEEIKRRETGDKKLQSEVKNRQEEKVKNQEMRTSEIIKEGQRLKIKEKVLDRKGQLKQEKETVLQEGEVVQVDRPQGEKYELKPAQGLNVEIKVDKFRSRTTLPVSVGQNNELEVTIKDGSKKMIRHLPDNAATKLKEKGYETREDEVDLEENKDGVPVYTFTTTKKKRILGIFPSTFSNSTQVSAESGEIVGGESIEQSSIKRFLERFAF